MKKLLLITAIIIFTACASEKKNNLVITQNSVTDYHIVLPETANEDETYAATLLQKSIYKVSGAKVPIVYDNEREHKREICIGKTRRDTVINPALHTINVKREKQRLFFSSSESKYTVYSVVDFLERYLNVRKFALDCEEYPQEKNIVLKDFKDYSYTTPNTYRQVQSAFTKESDDFKYWLKQDVQNDMFANGFFVHTSKILCPDNEYFASHPEYYALLNGKRTRDQVCWSNDTVYQIMKENLQRQMMLQPDKKVWSVSQNDNDTYCHCDRCMALINKEGSPSAPIIAFVNRLAKDFPDKTISTLAYTYSRKAPKTLIPEKNVQIMLCTIEENRNITIEEARQRNLNGSFAQDLIDWGKKTNNIFLWDYEVDFAYSVSPFPNIHVLQPNIQFFVKNNAFEQFQQANSETGHEFSELKTYLISKLLWNPNVNEDSIINEFLNGYYGKASKEIRNYIDDIEKVAISYKETVGLDIYGPPTNYMNNIFSKDNIERYSKIFDRAEDAVKDDSVCLLRVRTARLPLDYAIMEIAKVDMFGERGWYNKRGEEYVLKNDMTNRLEKFYSTAKRAGVRSMNESGLTVEDYYQTTRRFINVDVKNDIAFHKNVVSTPKASDRYCKGDMKMITNGVKGADDYKMHWLGWWGYDFSLDMDLDTIVNNKTITISSLCDAKSWILHPLKVTCLVSKDGKNYKELGEKEGYGNDKNSPVIREYEFTCNEDFRFVRFIIEGTKTLPAWHPSFGKPSWVFLDEIMVK
jgi:hypothetical protein